MGSSRERSVRRKEGGWGTGHKHPTLIFPDWCCYLLGDHNEFWGLPPNSEKNQQNFISLFILTSKFIFHLHLCKLWVAPLDGTEARYKWGVTGEMCGVSPFLSEHCSLVQAVTLQGVPNEQYSSGKFSDVWDTAPLQKCAVIIKQSKRYN